VKTVKRLETVAERGGAPEWAVAFFQQPASGACSPSRTEDRRLVIEVIT